MSPESAATVHTGMSDSLELSSVTVNCPDAAALADFYARITGGEVTFARGGWATMAGPGGRIDFQAVADYRPPQWPADPSLLHLDFLVDDLAAAAARVEAEGATRYDEQPNADHCLVFADPAGTRSASPRSTTSADSSLGAGWEAGASAPPSPGEP